MNLATLYFVVFVGVLLPIAAVRSYRKLNAGVAFPPKRQYLLSTLAVQLVTLTLALWAARANAISLWRAPRLNAEWLLGGIAFFALLTFTTPLRWRRSSEWRRRRLALLTPQHPRDYFLWSLVALAAGIGEEIVWRGVLFTLILRATDSIVTAMTISALHFGVCHVVQGPKSVFVVALIALVNQSIVLASGSLLPAMMIHFFYDLIAGIWFARLGRETQLPSTDLNSARAGTEV